MDLSVYLREVATTYDRTLPLGSPAQLLLRTAGEQLAEHVPGGLLVTGSGGQGYATFTPWVGVLDPDETTSPQRGIYVVYLFAEDLSSVVLSLQQGITELTKSVGAAAARQRLREDALLLRAGLGAAAEGLAAGVDFGSRGQRQMSYQAGNIVARVYEMASLPGEAALRGDLDLFLRLYQDAIAVKRRALLERPGSISSPGARQGGNEDALRHFKPKSDGDYSVHLVGREMIKSRRHERLIAEYGTWIADRGGLPATNVHPRDLVINLDGYEALHNRGCSRGLNPPASSRQRAM